MLLYLPACNLNQKEQTLCVCVYVFNLAEKSAEHLLLAWGAIRKGDSNKHKLNDTEKTYFLYATPQFHFHTTKSLCPECLGAVCLAA